MDFGDLVRYSDPERVAENAKQYFGHEVDLYPSSRKDKKYMIADPVGKMVHFGQYGAEDYTYHGNELRRQNYLNRATRIRGNWANDRYSPNSLSINLLWQ